MSKERASASDGTRASEATARDKSCCWSVTINNPTEEDLTQWNSLSGLHWVREVSGQFEKGEEGTLHLQGCLKTASVRFAQVKKVLPRAHIEAARAPAALAKYVVKEDTRVSSIPTVKTATQADVQMAVYNSVVEWCWRKEQGLKAGTFDYDDYKESDLIDKYAYDIRKDWEIHVDQAVRLLIKRGYYGVEFVMANPQVRTAFKKYLPEICYRYIQYGQAFPTKTQDGSSQEGSTS